MPRAQLVELHARNLGVIGEANLEFGQGFNVLTGETGAGKTLLLDALGLCLGDDASGTRHALAPATRAVALFRDTNGDEIVLGREMSDSGRLRSLVNGAPASVESLRHYAQGLIVIHGQHDSLLLRGRSEILRLIDDSAHLDTRELSDVRARLREARSLRDAMGGDDFTRQRELEFAAFQVAELESVRITSPSELDDDLGELARLSALRDGQAAIADVVEVIDGDADEAVLSRFAAAVELVPAAAAYDDIRRDLATALVQAREAVRELAELADPEAVDARLLGELEDRVGVLQGIARKYGGSLASALATLGDLRSRLARAGHDDERRRHIDEEIRGLEQREAECASALRGQRERAAAELSDRVARQLRRVALEHASLRFSVQGDDGSRGPDPVQRQSRSTRRSALGVGEWGRTQSRALSPLPRVRPPGGGCGLRRDRRRTGRSGRSADR